MESHNISNTSNTSLFFEDQFSNGFLLIVAITAVVLAIFSLFVILSLHQIQLGNLARYIAQHIPSDIGYAITYPTFILSIFTIISSLLLAFIKNYPINSQTHIDEDTDNKLSSTSIDKNSEKAQSTTYNNTTPAQESNLRKLDETIKHALTVKIKNAAILNKNQIPMPELKVINVSPELRNQADAIIKKAKELHPEVTNFHIWFHYPENKTSILYNNHQSEHSFFDVSQKEIMDVKNVLDKMKSCDAFEIWIDKLIDDESIKKIQRGVLEKIQGKNNYMFFQRDKDGFPLWYVIAFYDNKLHTKYFSTLQEAKSHCKIYMKKFHLKSARACPKKINS